MSISANRGSLESISANRGTLESVSANRGTLGFISANRGTLGSVSANRCTLESISANRGTLESISANRGTLGSISADRGTLESMSASRVYLRKQVHIRVYLIPGQRACSLQVSYVHNNWGKCRQLEGRELVLHASFLPAVIEYNNYYVHILVLKFLCTYSFVDLVKHGVLTLVGEIRYYRNNRYCCFVSRDSSVVESRTLDRKVAGSSRYRQERREEFYSPGSTFCADCYFGIRSTPVLPQYHVC